MGAAKSCQRRSQKDPKMQDFLQGLGVLNIDKALHGLKDAGIATLGDLSKLDKDMRQELDAELKSAGVSLGDRAKIKEAAVPLRRPGMDTPREQVLAEWEPLIGRKTWAALQAMKMLDLHERTDLTKLPESLGQFKNVTEILLNGCTRLEMLPTSIGELSEALWTLSVQGCNSLTKLPENFGELKALNNLYLNDCTVLAGLPENFGELQGLTYLSLSKCRSLATLPKNFGELKALKELSLDGCSSRITQHEILKQLPSECMIYR